MRGPPVAGLAVVVDVQMDSRDDCRKMALLYFLAAEETADREALVVILESAQELVRMAARAEGTDYGVLAQANSLAPSGGPTNGGCLVQGAIYKRLSEFWTGSSAPLR